MFFDGYVYIYIHIYIDSLVGIVFKDTYPHTCRHTDYAVNEAEMIGAKSWMKLWPSRKRKGLHHMTCIVSFCFVRILLIETLGSMGKWPGSRVGYGVPYPNHGFQIHFAKFYNPW